MSQFRFVVVAFSLTVVLMVAVCLRSMENRVFYKLCAANTKQNRLKQQLWHKQLRLESLISPVAVAERLGDAASASVKKK